MAARGAQTWNARALLYGPLRETGAGDTQALSGSSRASLPQSTGSSFSAPTFASTPECTSNQ
jgi:hypothetical protein